MKYRTTYNSINIISIIFGGLFLANLYKESEMIWFILTDNKAGWDFSVVLYFLPLLILPTATLLFFIRKKAGWILLAIYLAYSAISTLILLFWSINIGTLGIPVLDSLFPQPSSIVCILSFLFFSGTLWIICKENIRNIYIVNKKLMLSTIGIISILVFSIFI